MSSRINQDDIVDDDDPSVEAAPPPKRRRTSQRHWNNCQDIKKLPPELCCSGCKLVEDSSSNKPRSQCKSAKCTCHQGWKQDKTKIRVGMMPHVQKIKKWIADNENINCDEAFDAPTEVRKGRPAISPRVLLQTPQPTTKANTTTTNVIKPKDVTTTKEFKRPLNFWQQTIKCNGRELVCEIPTYHKIVLKTKHNKLKNDSEMLQSVKDKL